MGDYDSEVLVLRKHAKKSDLKTNQAINNARRHGQTVDTAKKFNAGANRKVATDKNTAKLDRETEELHHDRITMGVGKAIMQGRQAKEWTQKDLATKVNEKPQVINDYEAGRAIPNQQILAKIERQIGLKLRGKEIGMPLVPKSKKK